MPHRANCPALTPPTLRRGPSNQRTMGSVHQHAKNKQTTKATLTLCNPGLLLGTCTPAHSHPHPH